MTFHIFRFGVLNIAVSNTHESLEPILARSVDQYETLEPNEAIDLQIEVSPGVQVKRSRLRSHWDFADGWAGRFGHFFMQRWYLSEGVPRVVCSIARSPLAPLRPILDFEMHTAAQDIGKFLHESVLIPATLLLRGDEAVVFHGATLGTPDGAAALITGRGGVGKTSLALELRKRNGWSFISDDLVPIDARGVAYLNAAWPKIYAYNVAEDRDLERLILEGRSPLNRLHWRLLARWPHRVRRSVPPSRLFSRLEGSARLGYVLLVERMNTPKIGCRRASPEEVAQVSAVVLESEMARFGHHVSLHSKFRRVNGLSHMQTRWDVGLWRQVMGRALADVNIYRVSVPEKMSATSYRREMGLVMADIAGGSWR